MTNIKIVYSANVKTISPKVVKYVLIDDVKQPPMIKWKGGVIDSHLSIGLFSTVLLVSSITRSRILKQVDSDKYTKDDVLNAVNIKEHQSELLTQQDFKMIDYDVDNGLIGVEFEIK